jgi:hypothetical protein
MEESMNKALRSQSISFRKSITAEKPSNSNKILFELRKNFIYLWSDRPRLLDA